MTFHSKKRFGYVCALYPSDLICFFSYFIVFFFVCVFRHPIPMFMILLSERFPSCFAVRGGGLGLAVSMAVRYIHIRWSLYWSMRQGPV